MPSSFAQPSERYISFIRASCPSEFNVSDESINQVIEYRSPSIGSIEKEFVKRQMEHKNFRQQTRSLAKTEIQQQYQRQDELEINNHVIKLVTTR